MKYVVGYITRTLYIPNSTSQPDARLVGWLILMALSAQIGHIMPYPPRKLIIQHAYSIDRWPNQDSNPAASDADRTRLNSFLRRCVKLGYYSSNDPPTISSIADDVEDTLFKSILRNAQHVLPPYPEERPCHVDRRRALIGGAV